MFFNTSNIYMTRIRHICTHWKWGLTGLDIACDPKMISDYNQTLPQWQLPFDPNSRYRTAKLLYLVLGVLMSEHPRADQKGQLNWATQTKRTDWWADGQAIAGHLSRVWILIEGKFTISTIQQDGQHLVSNVR